MTTHNTGPRNAIQLARAALEIRDGSEGLDRLRSLGIVAPRRVGPAHARYELPWPPTVNHYWIQARNGVVLGPQGRQYRRDVQAAILLQGFSGRRDAFLRPDRLAVVIAAHVPDGLRRDLDNLLKASLDGMGHAGIYDDDSQIDDLRIIRAGVVPGGKLVIGLWRLGDARQEVFA